MQLGDKLHLGTATGPQLYKLHPLVTMMLAMMAETELHTPPPSKFVIDYHAIPPNADQEGSRTRLSAIHNPQLTDAVGTFRVACSSTLEANQKSANHFTKN